MESKKAQVFCLLLTSCCLLSCQTSRPEKATSAPFIAQAIEDMQEKPALPSETVSDQEMLDSLLPPIDISDNEIIEERFDVSVKNIDAKSFLLGLVDSTPYNIVVSPEVNESISLQLKNVTISEVLSAIERVYPLMVELQGNVFFVSSAESMTKVYPVDYLNIKRSGKSQTNVAGQTVATGHSNNNNQSSNNSSGNGQSNVTQINASEIITENKADFWTELSASLNLIIKSEDKASVIVSPHVGIVIVKALPSTHRLIREYLNITQSSLNRQVILEAKIIEVVLNDGYQAGIDWRKIYSVNSGDNVLFGQQGQVLNLTQGESPLNGVFSMLYQSNSFEAAINLLRTQGDVQVLSSPRVSTINNQKAVIKVGSDEFFVTDVSTTTVTGNSTATTPDVTLTPFFSGISLDVTPQINSQGEIVLHIHPIVSEVADQQKTLILGQDEFTLPLALSNVRESDSIIKAEDQQVIVIGGLMQNRLEKQENKMPVLGSVPVIGKLFTQERESLVKSELVILLKANLVSNEFNRKEINNIKKRFNQL